MISVRFQIQFSAMILRKHRWHAMQRTIFTLWSCLGQSTVHHDNIFWLPENKKGQSSFFLFLDHTYHIMTQAASYWSYSRGFDGSAGQVKNARLKVVSQLFFVCYLCKICFRFHFAMCSFLPLYFWFDLPPYLAQPLDVFAQENINACGGWFVCFVCFAKKRDGKSSWSSSCKPKLFRNTFCKTRRKISCFVSFGRVLKI